MNSSEEYLSGHWGALRSRTENNGDEIGIPSFKLEISTSHGYLRIALGAEGELRLLIPIDMTERISDSVEGEDLHVGSEVFVIDGKKVRFLDVICLEPALESVFIELVSEIIRRINEGAKSLTAIEETIKEFRRLLRRGGKRVNLEKVIGLIGELLLLRRIQEVNSSGWRSWFGPLKQRHDFVAANTAIEVKTTLRAQKPVVTINSIDQLESLDGGDLYLMHYVLEQNQAGVLHVPELANEVITRSSEPEEVIQLLEEEGYSSDVEDLWGYKRFDLRSADLYQVGEGFPRLILNNLNDSALPEGVSHVTYRADLAVARKYCLNDVGQKRVIRDFAGCL